MAKRKLRRHGTNVNVIALSINTKEVASSIGLPPYHESQGQDIGITTANAWPIVVVHPRSAMKKGSELSR